MAALLQHPHPDSPQWQHGVGYEYYKLGKIEPTLEHLQKAIRLDPSNEGYYLDLGEVLARNNARTAVVAVFEAARNARPDSLRIRQALGVAYLNLRDYEKAKAVFMALVESKPEDELGYRMLAECYDITRDYENTAKIAASLRMRNEKDSFGWYYGASAEYEKRLEKGESLDTAELYVRRALELAPNESQSHLLLGKVLMDSHRDEEAIAAFRRAIALRESDPKTYYLLARTLQRLGRARESADAFQAYKRAHADQAGKQRSLLVEIK